MNIKTSFIITKNEVSFLLSGYSGNQPGAVARYIQDTFLDFAFSKEEAIEGLTLKMMANAEGAVLKLEPVIDFLLKEVVTAQKFWRVEENNPALIIGTANLWLLITAYALAEDTYRVTPYQNSEEVKEALKETYGFDGLLEFI